MGNKYKNFWDVTKDALDFALLECGIGGHEKERDLVMAAYEDMHAWPDVDSSLQQLKQENVGVCFLSNMMEKMLRNGIENSNLAKYFDAVISTDEKQTYKPSRKAYQMTVEKLKLSAEQILFVPFAAWDMAGAKWFGYPTFWMNKLNSHREQLGVEPDGSGNTLNDLLEFIRKRDE